ncbi:MAG TPA: hypothetical protein VG603_01790 [Chitinophagales bacterium]|nr:hypothetical protein [Chitinophagales bacterium]
MRTLQQILIIGLVILGSFAKTNAAIKPAINHTNGDLVFSQTFKLSGNISADQAYELVQQWFTQNPAKFTSHNNDAASVESGSKGRGEVEEAFSNPRPLQSLDPESKRVAGRGVIKYAGGLGSSIGLMYLEYYIVVEVKGNILTATISQIKYHHYNRRTLVPQPIYGWQGGKPYDSADRYSALTEDGADNRDISSLSDFVNSDIASLLANLQTMLKSKNALS